MSIAWPQPYEGIRGADRDDWLLSLDEQAVTHREYLIAAARHLRAAVMVGHPAPVVTRTGEWMRSPVPGNLAVAAEVLHGQGDAEYRTRGLGIYLDGRREWLETDAEWAGYCTAENLDPVTAERLTDTVFYLQYGPSAADVCRWSNSEAVALPVTTTGSGIDAAAERDGSRAVFTRGSLIGALADSGITLRGMTPESPLDAETGFVTRQVITVLVTGGEGGITSIRDIPAPSVSWQRS